MTLTPRSLSRLDRRNTRRSGGNLGEGGTMREMAATSLHNDALLDSENCHERASRCTMTPWWEALRASEVAKWQNKNRIELGYHRWA